MFILVLWDCTRPAKFVLDADGVMGDKSSEHSRDGRSSVDSKDLKADFFLVSTFKKITLILFVIDICTFILQICTYNVLYNL